jgi:hypothetical protein
LTSAIDSVHPAPAGAATQATGDANAPAPVDRATKARALVASEAHTSRSVRPSPSKSPRASARPAWLPGETQATGAANERSPAARATHVRQLAAS